jgi:hypothetical protein
MDTHVGYHLLQNLGLAGGFAARLALLGSILLHGVILAVSHGNTVWSKGSSDDSVQSPMPKAASNSRTGKLI